jgi:hypothetical protein
MPQQDALQLRGTAAYTAAITSRVLNHGDQNTHALTH